MSMSWTYLGELRGTPCNNINNNIAYNISMQRERGGSRGKPQLAVVARVCAVLCGT